MFEFVPDGLTPIIPAEPIRAKKARRSRILNDMESLSLVLGALGTLSRTRGVKIANTEYNGSNIAVIVIENARFGADEKQTTTLSDVLEGVAVKET